MGKIIDGIKIGFWICLTIWLFFVWLYLVKWTWESSLWTNPINTSGQLYVNWSETLSSAKWNALVNELKTLKNQNNSVFSGTGFDVIYCNMSWWTHNPVWTMVKTFTAQDCGWKLPDDNYIPIQNALSIAWWFNSYDLFKYWESWFPWVTRRQISWMNWWTFTVYYLRVK